MYTSLERPHKEYANQFWFPHQWGDIIKMKRIQNRTTRMIPEMRAKTCPQWLEELNLISLDGRRFRGQHIETPKYLNSCITFIKTSPGGLINRDCNQRNRYNEQKLHLKPSWTSVNENVFPLNIPRIWNRLPMMW